MIKSTIFVFLVLVLFSGCVGTQYSTTPSTIINYYADTNAIVSQLEQQGYEVVKVESIKNDYNKYVVSIYINTKGDYDREAEVMHRAMFENSRADYYMAVVIDYELSTSWAFTATHQTLSDYFSGKISNSEYIRHVEKDRLI